MGYQVLSGPEVEEDKYNFEMMNLPKDHPGSWYAGYVLYHKGNPDADANFTDASENAWKARF